jgi:phage-related minor tail protein
MAKTVSGAVADMFISLGENVGKMQNPLGDIMQIMGNTLITLGKQLIITSELIASITKALTTALGGFAGAGIAVGIGLIAAGSFLKNAIPQFAEGGIVTGPTLGMIGERGPEVIFPLDRLREFMTGGSSQVVVLETRVRGDDLYLINSRTAARRGRAY